MFAVCKLWGMSNLASYLEQQGIKQADFAVRLGISRSFLSLIISGKRGLPLSLAFRIEEETNGAVTAKSFLSSQDGDAAPASQGNENLTCTKPEHGGPAQVDTPGNLSTAAR